MAGDTVHRVKDSARGRWLDILSSLGGLPQDVLDGQHHPCPRCGGTDRFRLVDAEQGAVLCNQCFHERNGDGISALEWARGWSFPEALHHVAEYLHLEVESDRNGNTSGTKKSRKSRKDDRKWTPGGSWAYRDEQGALLFTVYRRNYEDGTKSFRARRADGRWTLHGVRRIPYRLPELLALPEGQAVVVVEGEKAAEAAVALGLPATTSPNGSGHWDLLDAAALELAFRGRGVVVLPDADEPGRKHADQVAASLYPIARWVRIVPLPGLTPDSGDDVFDWIEKTRLGPWGEILTDDEIRVELVRLVRETPCWEPPATPATGSPPAVDAESPPAADEATITNYATEWDESASGNEKPRNVALAAHEVLKLVATICDEWPKRLGTSLCIDHGGQPCGLNTGDDVFAYFQKRSPGGVRWRDGMDADGRNFLSRGEVCSLLRLYAEPIQEFRRFPLHPQPAGVYVSMQIEDGRRGDGTAFFDFVRRFCPASPRDAALIEAMLLTFFWGGAPGGRPLFVVTGAEGVGAQEIGKTTLVHALSSVVGGPFSLHLADGKFDDPPAKQILSSEGMKHSVVLLDNLDGVTVSRDLAELVTAPAIDGRASHERQARRANYLTWVATAVTPALTTDLASRSVMIALDRPQRSSSWAAETAEFARAHAEQIAVDAITILREGARDPITAPHSRFPAWDSEVLALHPLANEVLADLVNRRSIVDADIDALELFLEALQKDALQTSRVEYRPSELARVWKEATDQPMTAVWISRRLRDAAAKGKLPTGIYRKWPGMHGSVWVVDLTDFMIQGSNTSSVEK